jgi:cytochrome P450
LPVTAAPSAVREAPTMPGVPLLGSALDFSRDLLATQLRAMRELGDVVRFSLGPPGIRLVLHGIYAPEGVQHVLAGASARYRKDNHLYDEMRTAFGDGLLTSQDDTWLRQKRFLQPLFTHASVAGYVPAMAAEAAELVRRWHPTARAGGTVELHGETGLLTLRVVGRVLFGSDLDAAVPVLREKLPALSEDLRRRGFAPLPTPAGWPTPLNLRERRHRAALDAVIDDLLASRRAGQPRGDLLGRLLAARDTEPGDGASGLTDDEVRDQVLVFLFAGSDTTATALTSALHLLGAHPDVQEKAHEEVRGVLAGRPPEADDLPALPYLTRVVKEALRLHPPAYATSRRLTGGDDEIGGVRMPDGADVGVYPWVTHRHPRHWDDPERFDPDRFTPEREAARHRYAWFPFGGGPRTCIGGHFALVEALTALSVVLTAYRVETPDRPLAVVPRITLHPAEPVPCRLLPR